MVDVSDLAKANELNAELSRINAALGLFDGGGRIVSITIADASMPAPPSIPVPIDSAGPVLFVTVQTSFMDYPAQMVEAIKSMLAVREEEVANEMSGLGLTGVSDHRR